METTAAVSPPTNWPAPITAPASTTCTSCTTCTTCTSTKDKVSASLQRLDKRCALLEDLLRLRDQQAQTMQTALVDRIALLTRHITNLQDRQRASEAKHDKLQAQLQDVLSGFKPASTSQRRRHSLSTTSDITTSSSDLSDQHHSDNDLPRLLTVTSGHKKKQRHKHASRRHTHSRKKHQGLLVSAVNQAVQRARNETLRLLEPLQSETDTLHNKVASVQQHHHQQYADLAERITKHNARDASQTALAAAIASKIQTVERSLQEEKTRTQQTQERIRSTQKQLQERNDEMHNLRSRCEEREQNMKQRQEREEHDLARAIAAIGQLQDSVRALKEENKGLAATRRKVTELTSRVDRQKDAAEAALQASSAAVRAVVEGQHQKQIQQQQLVAASQALSLQQTSKHHGGGGGGGSKVERLIQRNAEHIRMVEQDMSDLKRRFIEMLDVYADAQQHLPEDNPFQP